MLNQKIKYILAIPGILFILSGMSLIAHAEVIGCQVNQNAQSVTIDMPAPHPSQALIHRPGAEVVWLQTPKDFVNLKIWIIDQNTYGTVFTDGKAAKQQVLTAKGEYQLVIADNLETELENTNYLSCNFRLD